MVISFVFPSTAIWAQTALVPWSRHASRCGAGRSPVLAPRTVLPSTASTGRRPGARRAATMAVTHEPMARSRAAGSTAVRTRQIVTRSGTAPGRPSPARRPGPASTAHSAIAANDRAPARVAHTATASTGTRSYRTPRGSRGSGTCASASSSPGGTPPAAIKSRRERASSWPAARTIGEDGTAGTAPGDDHDVSTTS
jgi:hypothetical protein